MSGTERARGRRAAGPREAADEMSLHQSFARTGVGDSFSAAEFGDRHFRPSGGGVDGMHDEWASLTFSLRTFPVLPLAIPRRK
jgi:hypothetical protein